MSIFSHLRSHQAQEQPVKKPEMVIHPQNAPRTVPDNGFPEDFADYKYAGATLEMVNRRHADGSVIRLPALVANMVHEHKIGGVSIREDMTVSIRDLKSFRHDNHRTGHPDASSIAAALSAYYDSKVAPEHQEQVKDAVPEQSRPQTDLDIH